MHKAAFLDVSNCDFRPESDVVGVPALIGSIPVCWNKDRQWDDCYDEVENHHHKLESCIDCCQVPALRVYSQRLPENVEKPDDFTNYAGVGMLEVGLRGIYTSKEMPKKWEDNEYDNTEDDVEHKVRR